MVRCDGGVGAVDELLGGGEEGARVFGESGVVDVFLVSVIRNGCGG